MDHAKEVDTFVHQCFNIYGLNFKWFFHIYFDDVDEDGNEIIGHSEELPLVVGDNIDMELLSQAAAILGVSTEALEQMDRDAVSYWYNKYPYFNLRRKFELAREHSRKFTISSKEMAEERLIFAIYGEKYRPKDHRCYKGDVKKRLTELLKTYNDVMPGCYHEGSEITRLTIQTNNFTHFEQINEMAESYLSMVSRARELFYRLWDEDLPEAEVNEYNFLVSVLGMRDIAYFNDRPIYYELARKFAPVYKQEGYTDYASYIKYRDADFPEFYVCKEFYDYPDLVERLVQEFPNMKAEIGRMAILAKNFYCSFVWSDEPEPPIDAAFDEYLVGALRDLGNDSPSWYHRVYVPKNKDELYGDEKYIAICERLAAPASQGGLKQPIPECYQKADSIPMRVAARIQRRDD